ncbi:glycosyltransferase family 39 protein [Nocardia sp. alder85J]|uniref:glycosyltransferase family 39 protein n=1 Tax=Nocardia sp. alder85J TaxID=2862949 RepID=UPI001CD5590D|nr:glycosyltransferase family 39 protein [Nocardia sp. alder85J]MCX4098153.1 glycosyltransferase family 39 protein [Nocardia sp. alder85J]
MTLIETPVRRAVAAEPAPPRPVRPRNRWWFGPPDQPRWVRPSFWGLIVTSAVLYLVGFTRNGWGNDYYAAAVQAGTKSWKALLFGALDAGNSITVDKPPAAMWMMGLSGRLFGFSSFSMLLPEALMGIASVALVYATVRRWNGPAAGLLAGSLLALTPVAALMFRFDNPDALLVFLLCAAAYCTVRATETGSGRWLTLTGVALGFGFLAKMMQAFLVLPAFGLVFLIAAPIGLWKRLGKLALATVALIVSGGWFVALVALWPAASRPYIGGSTSNSLWELAMDYNGLGRVFGGSGNHGGGGGGGGSFGGGTGLTRLFGDQIGTEISWLLPAALIGLVAGLWFTRRAPRTGRTRSALVLWGGWLLVTFVVFSYMQGTMHPYYTVALAPAIAAVLGISLTELWRGRGTIAARVVLGVMLAATGIWNYVLLDRTPDWYPALRWIVLIGAIVVAAVTIVGLHQLGRTTVIVAAAGLLFGLAGSTAYTIDTVATVHTGSIPSSGPSTGHGFGGPGGGMGAPGGGSAAGGTKSAAGGTNSASGGADSAAGGTNSAAGTNSAGNGTNATAGTANATGSGDATGDTANHGGGFGGPGGNSDNAEVRQLLTDSSGYRWAAAAVGAQSTASLELNTGTSVMAIGGFTGSDPSPTPAQFQQYVADGDIHYFIAGGGMGPGGDSGSAAQISTWVQQHYQATTVGGTTVYDLTAPIS